MKINKHLQNILITALILVSSFGISLLLVDVQGLEDQITTVFVFAVFLISALTDGYVYGIAASALGVLAVNFAFVFPYFSFDIEVPENVFSALIMISISVMTSTLTTKLKRWKNVKAESEREKMKANLLRAVSHDIRTPLTTIYGSSSVMLDGYDNLSDTQRRAMISGIKEDSEWLIRMVENLLSVTKIDSGTVKLIKTPTVLDELIDSVMIKFKKRYPDTAVEINLPQDMVIIPMDAILVEQVLVNLMDNSVRHGVGMTHITLNVRTHGDSAVFEVIDDGEGIPKEKLQNIFTGYFAKTNPDGDQNGKNAGIGLSVCASIIKAHGGVISCENLSPKGVLFRFILSIKEDASLE